MVPIDGSKNSERAIRFAADLAKRFQAKITLIHVLATRGYLAPFAVFYERALNRLAQRGFPVRCVDFKDYPWVEIDDHADLDLAGGIVKQIVEEWPGETSA